LDANDVLQSSATTPTELGFVHGVTSGLCGINQSCTYTNKSISGSTNTFTNIPLGTAVTGLLPIANGGTAASSTSQNFFFAGPNSGSGPPAFRAIVGGDLPNPSASTLGGVESYAAVSNQWINSISTSGVPTSSQPAFSNISGTASLTSQVTGTLPTANGGTGQASYSDGQLLIGNTSTGSLSLATLTAGTNITVTNGHGSISIAASGSAAAALNPVAKTSAYSANINDWVIASSTSFSITLPDATTAGSSGKSILIQHAGTSLTQVYTLLTTSSQTINGPGGTVAGGQYSLFTNGEKVLLVSDGANWQVADHTTATQEVSAGVNGFTATAAFVFTIPSSSITIGSHYTNNGQDFYVSVTTVSSTTLTMYGTGAPTPSTGTLTCVTCTPSGNINYTAVTTTGQPSIGSATVVANFLKWYRIGQRIYVTFDYTQTAAGTAANGSGDYLLRLPTPADTTQYIVWNGAANGSTAIKAGNNLGNCLASINGSVGVVVGSAYLYDANYIRCGGLIGNNSPTAGSAMVGSGTPSLSNANFLWSGNFSYIPAGLGASGGGWQP
jgi:hypothetical protein